MKLDILAFGAHPDDVELGCSGTLMKHIDQGKKVGVIDITKGELGTRGSGELRLKEADAAAKLMKIHARENLGLPDGFFGQSKEETLEVIKKIRKYQPEIVICNAIHDRHPDHARASKLVADACFLSGLVKVETFESGTKQEPWRPKAVCHYIQYYDLTPDFVVDISGYMQRKLKSIKAYASQFYDPSSKEPETVISQQGFLEEVESRAKRWGKIIGTSYAEGYTTEKYVGVKDLLDLL